VIETVVMVGDAMSRNPTINTVSAARRRIDEEFLEDAPKIAAVGSPFRNIVQTGVCDFICPVFGDQFLFRATCRDNDCPNSNTVNSSGSRKPTVSEADNLVIVDLENEAEILDLTSFERALTEGLNEDLGIVEEVDVSEF
jgi:hypothetical protein